MHSTSVGVLRPRKFKNLGIYFFLRCRLEALSVQLGIRLETKSEIIPTRLLLQELEPRGKKTFKSEKRVRSKGSTSSNGIISRTKHRRYRGVQRLSNVLRSSH